MPGTRPGMTNIGAFTPIDTVLVSFYGGQTSYQRR
jgi:hypothetical protein